MEHYIHQFGYPLIVITMILVGLMGAFPSSKLLYTTCGYLISTGSLSAMTVIFLGALGHSIGNLMQYQLGRYKGEFVFSRWLRISSPQMERFQRAFLQRPIFWLFFGKLVDPIKWVISFIAGTHQTPITVFFPMVLFTSVIWAGVFCYLGYAAGQSIEHFGWIGLLGYLLGIAILFIFTRSMTTKLVDQQLDVTKKRARLKRL